MTTPNTALTTKDVAEALDITAKELRVFLRSCGDTYTPPGSGGRYSFVKSDVAKIKKGYAAFVAERDKARAEKEKAKAVALAVVAEETAEGTTEQEAS